MYLCVWGVCLCMCMYLCVWGVFGVRVGVCVCIGKTPQTFFDDFSSISPQRFEKKVLHETDQSNGEPLLYMVQRNAKL